MAVSICYIFPSPPTQKPPVPSVPLWGAGESVPVPAATKPSSVSWSPGTYTDGTGRKGGHLDGDLTREAKMAGLAHEVSCIMVFFLCVRACVCVFIGDIMVPFICPPLLLAYLILLHQLARGFWRGLGEDEGEAKKIN